SCQRGAQRHQRSPGCNPGKPHCKFGVERSLPADFENSRNSAVITTHTVCEPTSSGPVLQQPSRKKPVIGDFDHAAHLPPSTFLAMGSRSTPLVLAMRIMLILRAFSVQLASIRNRCTRPGFGTMLGELIQQEIDTWPDSHCSKSEGIGDETAFKFLRGGSR